MFYGTMRFAKNAPRLRAVFGGATVGLILLAGLAACGGGGNISSNPPPTNTGIPAGTYTVVVSAAAQSTRQTLNLQVVVQ